MDMPGKSLWEGPQELLLPRSQTALLSFRLTTRTFMSFKLDQWKQSRGKLGQTNKKILIFSSYFNHFDLQIGTFNLWKNTQKRDFSTDHFFTYQIFYIR